MQRIAGAYQLTFTFTGANRGTGIRIEECALDNKVVKAHSRDLLEPGDGSNC
jgi:hypothetical protein